jgi:hypothetical protein
MRPSMNRANGAYPCRSIPCSSGPGSVGRLKSVIANSSPTLAWATNNAGTPPPLCCLSSGVPGSILFCFWLVTAPGAFQEHLTFPPAGGAVPGAGRSILCGVLTGQLSGVSMTFSPFVSRPWTIGVKRKCFWPLYVMRSSLLPDLSPLFSVSLFVAQQKQPSSLPFGLFIVPKSSCYHRQINGYMPHWRA